MREDSFYRKRALKIGADVERMIVILLAQGQGFIDTRRIWGILSLDKKYPSDVINEACRQAIAVQSFSYRTVLSFINQQGRYPKEENFKKPTQNKFARPLEVYSEQLSIFEPKTIH